MNSNDIVSIATIISAICAVISIPISIWAAKISRENKKEIQDFRNSNFQDKRATFNNVTASNNGGNGINIQ